MHYNQESIVMWIFNRRVNKINAKAQILKRNASAKGGLKESPFPSRRDFLDYMGMFLKHKKHEWVFIAFMKNDLVNKFWINKGNGGESANLKLEFYEIADICQDNGYNGILVGHNHPSGALSPSKQDRLFFEDFIDFFSYYKISLESLVFVAGRWRKYGLSFMQKIRRL